MKKRMFSTFLLGLLICTATPILAGCGEEEIVYEMKAYTAEELQPDTYYVQQGDVYYPVAPGSLTVEAKGDRIAKEANPDRSVWYTQDDCMIPTLYADGALIYVSNSTVPASYVWERFEDEGYSIGVKGLKQNDGGNYSTLIGPNNINMQSSVYPIVSSLAKDTELFVDKVGGQNLTPENVSRGGSVLGLQANRSYSVDFYVGTQVQTKDVIADTHIFTSFEKYETADYHYDNTAAKSVIRITVPEYLISGFYYINGAGLFRYVDNTTAMGDLGINFNQPYFLGTDENGKIVTIDTLAAQETSEEPTEETQDIRKYRNEINLDCTQLKMTVTIQYSDPYVDEVVPEPEGEVAPGMEDVVVQESLPKATMTDPEGTVYDFVEDIRTENALMFEVQCPLTGNWVIEIWNMGDRTFTIDTDFESGHSDSVIHAGNGRVQMEAFVDKPYNEGVIKFTWENQDHAADITVTTPEGQKYGGVEGDVIYSDYGTKQIYIGYMTEGTYKFEVSGEDLGRIRYQVLESGETAVSQKIEEESESSDEETEDSEESETSEEVNAG